MTGDGRTRCAWAGNDAIYIDYHDREWGVPLHDDRALFEMLILEGAQAGLSWITILKKRDNYRVAFDGNGCGGLNLKSSRCCPPEPDFFTDRKTGDNRKIGSIFRKRFQHSNKNRTACPIVKGFSHNAFFIKPGKMGMRYHRISHANSHLFQVFFGSSSYIDKESINF